MSQVLTSSPWADNATITEVYGFTIIDFGATQGYSRDSVIGDNGHLGAYAYGDGIVVWSLEVRPLEAAIGDRQDNAAQPVLAEASEAGTWSTILTHTPRHFSEMERDYLDCDADYLRELVTSNGDHQPYLNIAALRDSINTMLMVVVEHETAEMAETNANLIPAIVDLSVVGHDKLPLTAYLKIEAAETRGRFLFLRVDQLKDEAENKLIFSNAFLIVD